MKIERAEQILKKIKEVKIAVYGDFCIDAYWMLDPRGSEKSVETNLPAQAVAGHYYKLGGAANVATNLAALKPAGIKAIGVIGDDIFGRELMRQLAQLSVDTTSMIVQKENFDTITFGKRYLHDNEQRRIDFGFFNKRSLKADDILLQNLRKALENCDVVVFNQQVPASITNDEFIVEANKLFAEFNDKIVLLDSRHFGDRFSNVYRKTNDIEAARLNGAEAMADDIITLADAGKYAENLYNKSKKPVFITRGSRGILTFDDKGLHEVPAIQLLKKLDTVGAGDTTISALAIALAGGAKPAEAAEFANLAAAVTVQKLFQTGTASAEEIIELSEDADYIYQPELAEDYRKAEYLANCEIELCCEKDLIELGRVKHVVFDHDGTISTLRQGWEAVMTPMMIKAILGDEYKTADETLYHKVRKRVIDYIDKSTGIQTIIQMEALVEMVAEFAIVASGQILDKYGYKDIYNDALMEMVNERIAKFQTGRLDINDYTIKGAVEFLKALKEKGVKLYLASGTDREDVIAEADVLGYADLFEGRIYGALGDVSKYSKKMVIEKIISENSLSGCELAVFGDGPVELRQCRKHEGIAVGLASDEIRRHDMNHEKRTRLIKAGAHIIAADFSQPNELLRLLFG